MGKAAFSSRSALVPDRSPLVNQVINEKGMRRPALISTDATRKLWKIKQALNPGLMEGLQAQNPKTSFGNPPEIKSKLLSVYL